MAITLSSSTGTSSTNSTVPWLVVDGIYIREGLNGPLYRTVGYNCYVMKSAGGTVSQTMNAVQREAFFGNLRPNSLTRVWAFAPVDGTFTWNQVLTELDAIVNTAKKYKQRLIFSLTGMGVAANDAFGGKNATWFNNRTWRNSVSGSTSLENWTKTVVTRYKSDPTVSIYDLINEPLDTSGSFTADLILYGQEMAGYVKQINPNALVYSGTMYASALGGQTQYNNYSANMDFCAAHNYDSTGFYPAQSSQVLAAQTLNKPLIIDEFGSWSKFTYGTSSDSDKDTNGLPAVSFEAQDLIVKSFIDSAFAIPNVFGALIWSYMDSDASWYDGLGHYEPVNQSPVRKTIATFNINEPGRLASNQFSSLTSWIDAVFSLRHSPGTQIGGPNSGTTTTNLIYDRISANYRQATQANAPFSARDPLFDKVPTLRFAGAQNFQTTSQTGGSAHSLFAVVCPTSYPSSGNFSYIVAPSSATTGFAVRLTSAGTVQLVDYGNGTPVIIGTGNIVLPTTRFSLIEVRWDASGGGWRIRVNANADVNGTTTSTLAANVMLVGSATGQASGFVGHIAELMKFNSSIGVSDQNRLYAYFGRKYGVFV